MNTLRHVLDFAYMYNKYIIWEIGNITIPPGEVNDRKSKVIGFVVNAGLNVIANNFYIYFNQGKNFLCLKFLF